MATFLSARRIGFCALNKREERQGGKVVENERFISRQNLNLLPSSRLTVLPVEEIMTLPHLPILRAGTAYESLDTVELKNLRGGASVALVSQANAGMLRRDMAKIGAARRALQECSAAQLLEISQRAGELFMNAELPLGLDEQTQGPQQFIECLSATTGLPHALCRLNMGKVAKVFTEMPTILRGLTRGLDTEILRRGYGEENGVPVSFYPLAEALTVILPSNSPGVNSIWMPAIALGIPVVLKPGREDPWTPLRVIQSFIAAGAPREAFSFYPTDHEGSNALMQLAQRALIFGDENTVARHAGNPAVQVHGPGRSKVLVGDDCIENWRDYVDIFAESISANGGRSCINASCVVVPKYGREIAETLAEKLAQLEPLPHDDERAILAGFANPAMPEMIDAVIEGDLDGAEDVTAKYRVTRRAELEGSNYLRPTVVHCPNFAHPLANREFLFPYASVVEVPQEKMLEQIGPSLVVTAITDDEKWIGELLASPLIERLNIGPLPTNRVEWDQPHEGNLFEFLFKRRAIQRAK
jgi:acyl-CoA reductase-like NAD-dependent aldehyde dehydrogenase